MNKDKEEMNEVKKNEEEEDNSTLNSSSSSSSKSNSKDITVKKDSVLSPELPGEKPRYGKEINRIIHDDAYKLVFAVYGGDYLKLTEQAKKQKRLEDVQNVEFVFYFNKQTGRLFGTKSMFDLHFKCHNTITETIVESNKAFFIDKDFYGKKKTTEKAKQLNKELKDAGLKCTHGAKYFDVANLEHFLQIIDPTDKLNLKFKHFMDLLKPFIDISLIKQRPIEERKHYDNNDDVIVKDGPFKKKGKRTNEDIIKEMELHLKKANDCLKKLKK